MKKYDKIFLSLGTLFAIVPIYSFFGWFYIMNTYSELDFSEKANIYFTKILFGFFEGRYPNLFAVFIPGLISGIFLLLSLLNSLHYSSRLKNLKVFIFVLNLVFCGFILWQAL